MMHYAMITNCYPSMAIGWILGAVGATLILAFGVHGIIVSLSIWIALYADVTAFQLWLYFTNRRYNVSPYEGDNSTGLRGIVMSVVAAPVYASQLVATLLRRPARFVVTPKGATASRDKLSTFRRHLQWVALLASALVAAVILGHATTSTVIWASTNILICLAPIVQWCRDAGRTRRLDTAAVAPSKCGEIQVPRREGPPLTAIAPSHLGEGEIARESMA
jgi:hypothetical protein